METTIATTNKLIAVRFNGQSFPVKSIQDAQRKWIAFRDGSGGGCSEIGCGVTIKDESGNFVADISYNGRIWLEKI